MEFLKTEGEVQVVISNEKLGINPEGSCVTWQQIEITKGDATKLVNALIKCHGLSNSDIKGME